MNNVKYLVALFLANSLVQFLNEESGHYQSSE